jgi:hypothetical protein
MTSTTSTQAGREINEMAFKSSLFSKDPRHAACQANDAAHYAKGLSGTHIADVQAVLNLLDDLFIESAERSAQTYGPSTAAAVLAFKRKRKIINTRYQTTEDDIVGKMTITALDDELAAFEARARLLATGRCIRGDGPAPPRKRAAPPIEDGLTLRPLTNQERDEIA